MLALCGGILVGPATAADPATDNNRVASEAQSASVNQNADAPRADCSACPQLAPEDCEARVLEARGIAAKLLPRPESALGVMVCKGAVVTVSFPIPEHLLPRPAVAGAPPYPGARNYAHVRYVDGHKPLLLSE